MNTLLIKNGRLFDPASKLDERADILVKEGIISAIGSFEPEPGWQTVDASGCIVTPGLIDMHAHLYPFLPTGIQAESACFATGVTTAVDAGSSGCGTYPYYRPFLQYSKLRMKVFIHVSTAGIIEHPIAENVDPIHFDAKRIGEVLKICGNEIMGLKIRISREIVGELGIKPLLRALEIADEVNLPLMVHPTDPPCTMQEIVKLLRPGDILSHAYHNTGHTIIAEDGHVYPEIWHARERGVLFDVANDRRHFGFSTAKAAIADGFLPDIISSDLTSFDAFQYPTTFSLSMLASKYLALGLSMEQILPRMTSIPAGIMGIAGETGALRQGMCADIAVFKMIDKHVLFGDRPAEDPRCQYQSAEQILKPMMTVREGSIVFRDCEI